MIDMESDFQLPGPISEYKSVVDRYYTRRYKLNIHEQGNDHCVLVHSNRISVITLAPSHPILKEKKEVTEVTFQVNPELNHLDNAVMGKSKRGATSVNPKTFLCHVTCSDGSKHTLCACLKGSLLEVNENLVKNPGLLTSKPSSDGYIGIVLCHLREHESQIKSLLPQEQYEERMKKAADAKTS